MAEITPILQLITVKHRVVLQRLNTVVATLKLYRLNRSARSRKATYKYIQAMLRQEWIILFRQNATI